MNGWVKFSIKNTGFVILVMIMLLVGGGYASTLMKLEEMPNVDVPYLRVVIPYPGATPDQALEDIGKPVEQALANLENLKNLYVISGSGYVALTMEFSLSQPMDEAERNVNSALVTVKMPEGALKPQIGKEGPAAVPVYSFSVVGNAEQATIQEYVNDSIKPGLATIPGVSSVDVQGAGEKKLFVKLDPAKLEKEHLTYDKVKQTLLANNISIPAGQVVMDGKNLNVEVSERVHSLAELENLQLVVIEQDMSSLSGAFQEVGKGFEQVGSSVGQLGQGVGALAQGQGLLQAEIQVMQAIDGLSAAMFADQATLANLNEQLKANPDQAGALQPQITALQQKIQQEQQQIAALQGQLSALQTQVKASGADMEGSLKGLQGTGTQKSTSPNTDISGKPGYSLRTLQLKDIAEITYEPVPDAPITRVNGKPAVITNIKAEPGTNTVELVKEVNKKLTSVAWPTGYQMDILHDGSKQVEKTVNGMLREALLGALFAMLVTFLFLRNVRTTSVAILSIPLSIFAALIVLYLLDYSLNVMTLAGLAVAVGRVVDDSIVVIENVYRRVRSSDQRDANLIVDATLEVGKAITFSTITTIAVFAPLAFVPGIVGKYFVPFAIAVVIALAFSLLVAVSVVPLLSKHFLLGMKHVEPKENRLQKGYRRLLEWSLAHKLAVTLIALAMFGGTLAIVPQIPQNFLPSEKTTSYGLKVTMPINSATEVSDRAAKQVETELAKRADVETYQTFVYGENVNFQIELKEDTTLEDTKKFEQEIRTLTSNLGTGISAALTPQSLTSYGGGLYIVVNGNDRESLKQAGDMIVDAIDDVPGLADVHTNFAAVKPQISADINAEAAAENALNPAMIGLSLRQMISGDDVMNVNLDGRNTIVNLGIETGNLDTVEMLGQQKLTNMVGEQVKLADVATISEKPGPTSVNRLNQKEYLSIVGQLTTDNASGVQAEVQNRMKSLSLPTGVTYYFEGEAKAMDEGFRNMAVAIAIAILLVYLVMIVGFQEMLAPFAILFSLPFVFVGGLWGLYLAGESMGTPAMLGFLMLIGIVVTNAIVLLDRALRNKRSGMNTREGLVEAGVVRLRPILMTAFATVGALIPLAVSTEGGIISRSMAIVVIAGLSTTTLMTLIIVPVAYQALDSLRDRILHSHKEGENMPAK